MQIEPGTRDIALVALGLAIVIGCIVVAYASPATFRDAQFQMRVLTALGGGLLGSAIPGFIGIDTMRVRAVGSAAFVVLFYLVTPLALNRSADSVAKPQAATPTAAVPTPSPKPAGAPATHINSPHIEGTGTINAEYH